MNETIRKAVLETYKKYGSKQASIAISKAILEDDFNYFTNSNCAREQLISNLNNEHEFWDEIFNQYIMYVLNSSTSSNALEQAIQETYKEYENDEDVFIGIKKCLDDFYNGKNHFTRMNSARKNLNDEFIGVEEQEFKEKLLGMISEKVVSDTIKETVLKISNVNTYGENLQRGQQEMITGLTHDKEGSIYLANMQATTSIGNARENQEDAVLLKVHPKNPKFKILLVSDGMGGGIAGEETSHIVVDEISKWFDNIPEKYYENIEELKHLMNIELKRISELVNKKYKGQSGATVVSAIIGKDDTLITNIGDSRAYALKDRKLKQITEDESLVQTFYNNGDIEQKDDMRFHKSSNIVFQILGTDGNVVPQFITLKNNEYDKLLLFSDGVTDCLSDEMIKIITQRTDKKEISKEIVRAATNRMSFLRPELLDNPSYEKVIPGGKDNTTAAVYENER